MKKTMYVIKNKINQFLLMIMKMKIFVGLILWEMKTRKIISDAYKIYLKFTKINKYS